MSLLLFVILLVVPVLELYVIVEVAGSLGVVPTLALLIAVSLFGTWLVWRQGAGVVRRARESFGRGDLPTDEALNGLLILTAGILLLTPGFVTDAVGLLLLIPPTRALVRMFAGPRILVLLKLPFAAAGTAARARASRATGGRVHVGRAVIVTSGTELANTQSGSPSGSRGNDAAGSMPGSMA
jgi:UPF0716 protein FxsA